MNDQLMAQRHMMTHHALGTRINLTIFGNKYFSLLKKSMDLIDHYEDQLTVNRDQSEVMSVNQGAGKTPKMVSPSTFDLIEMAVKYSRENFGFNALIGPLVKLWKIGFNDARVPRDAEIKERLKLIDPYKVLLNRDNHTVYLEEPGMELDLGGIAKGYIADRIRDQWRAAGVPAGIIDLGGNLLFVGKSPRRDDGQWIIGVQDPQLHRGENLTTVREPACSAVTSGIYERFLIKNGRRYHHLLDPRTGYPLETTLSSVTVFTDQSVMGEIEAKRLFFNGGPITGWENHPGNRGAILIRNDESMLNVGLNKLK
ncbi:FAD:protein FMN transferase [Limosilactobacillus agrestis]|uniref:FAD:protein FMN transferase n=1 Tax=Limosilactobacillus agrestis TaxID=2759748 RepID=A0ABS8RCY7_9LACO|nr:FAD:protein FMN transferase [Limosilactobacillus agrestis]MCD7120933.1 FAD:protein FMN transferase [Limosilactobacillus agrestis]MCD7131305.1 FAD:protein FMN transferase [Limosilactobacillus agrestis]